MVPSKDIECLLHKLTAELVEYHMHLDMEDLQEADQEEQKQAVRSSFEEVVQEQQTHMLYFLTTKGSIRL